MKALLELHFIQNFVSNNLNRDDNGSPKNAYFGGVCRARVSSQSFKRAIRQDFASRALLSAEEIGVRTKRAHELLGDYLAGILKESEHSQDFDDAQIADLADKASFNAIDAIVSTNVSKKDDQEVKRAGALMFCGRDELQKMSQLILDNWEEFKKQIDDQDSKKKGKGLSKQLQNKLEAQLDGSRAVDIALFGRMLADIPERNVDAAAQVAHALGTHAVRREFDFYTGVDDLKADDTAGADMLGTLEFSSTTLYRYTCIDLVKLSENLDGDSELVLRGLKAFLYASIYAIPTGKQNSYAAHNVPSLVSATIRENASPRNLANAFERPVKHEKQGYIGESIQRLNAEWGKQERIFGQRGSGHYINAHDETESGQLDALGQQHNDIETLINAVIDAAQQLLENAANTTQAGKN